MERYTRWEPVSNIDAPCADIVLHADPRDAVLLLRFSQVRDAAPRDLRLAFGRDVIAAMTHEEFVHPWQQNPAASGPVPRLDGLWVQYAFPLLEVHESAWLASFSDGQILEPERVGVRHFRLVSLDNTVDVLTRGEGRAEWVPAAI